MIHCLLVSKKNSQLPMPSKIDFRQRELSSKKISCKEDFLQRRFPVKRISCKEDFRQRGFPIKKAFSKIYVFSFFRSGCVFTSPFLHQIWFKSSSTWSRPSGCARARGWRVPTRHPPGPSSLCYGNTSPCACAPSSSGQGR